MNIKKKLINICLSCVGGILVFDFIKSLRNQKDFNVSVTGIDRDKNASGKVLCEKFYQINDPNFEIKYLNKLIKILNENKIDVFFPLSDKECEVITNNLSYLKKQSPKTIIWLGSSEPEKILFDKEKFLSFCKINKFYTENYFIIENFTDFKKIALEQKNKKLILKSLTGSGSKGVFLINKDLKKNINILRGRDCYETNISFHKNKFKQKEKYVLMPYFEGDFFDVDCIVAKGKLLDFSIRKRNNKNQFLFYSTGHQTIKNNLIKKTIAKFVKIAKIDGPCDFDVILRNNKVILMEASARLSGSVGICTKAGINFPAQAIRKSMNFKYKKMILKKNITFRTFLTSDIISKKNSKAFMEYYIPYFEKQLKY